MTIKPSPKAEQLRNRVAAAVAAAIEANPDLIELIAPDELHAFGQHCATLTIKGGDKPRQWDLVSEMTGGLSVQTDIEHPTPGPMTKMTWHVNAGGIVKIIARELEAARESFGLAIKDRS